LLKNAPDGKLRYIDAEAQIAEAEKRIAQLRATASVIRKMIAACEPWPGDPNGLVETEKSDSI
jgi:cell division protein FtsB